MYSYTPSLTSAVDRGWLVNTTPRPLYPRERPRTHFTRGPRHSLDGSKNFLPQQDFSFLFKSTLFKMKSIHETFTDYIGVTFSCSHPRSGYTGSPSYLRQTSHLTLFHFHYPYFFPSSGQTFPPNLTVSPTMCEGDVPHMPLSDFHFPPEEPHSAPTGSSGSCPGVSIPGPTSSHPVAIPTTLSRPT
jgi:hypothetical protein